MKLSRQLSEIFIRTVQDNPEYDILYMVDGDVFREGEMWLEGEIRDVKIWSCVKGATGIWRNGDDKAEVLGDFYSETDVLLMGESELDCAYENLPWEPTILVFISQEARSF